MRKCGTGMSKREPHLARRYLPRPQLITTLASNSVSRGREGPSPPPAPGPGTLGERRRKNPCPFSGHQLPTPHDWNQLTPESASASVSSSRLSREVRALSGDTGGRAPPASPLLVPHLSSQASAGGDTMRKSYLDSPGAGPATRWREVGSSVQPHGGGGGGHRQLRSEGPVGSGRPTCK